MKLILASTIPSMAHKQSSEMLIGKPLRQTRAIWNANASDLEDETDWVNANRCKLEQFGLSLIDLDLRQYMNAKQGSKDLAQILAQADLLWVNGGNTFYLRWLMHASGADLLITQAARDGLVYGGGSAGVIVAGPTLDHFQGVDQPDRAPQVILKGLGLTSTVIVSHIDNPDFATGCLQAGKLLQAEGFATVTLTDAQIAIIDNETPRIY